MSSRSLQVTLPFLLILWIKYMLFTKEINVLQKYIGSYEIDPTEAILGRVNLSVLNKKNTKQSVKNRLDLLSYISGKNFNHMCENKSFFTKKYLLKENISSDHIISLENILDEQGVRYYKNAILEEYNDTQYRKKVLVNASSYHNEKKWTKKPIIYIGGPSSSGKSYATDKAIDVYFENNISYTQSDHLTKMIFVRVDGGIAREVSQISSLILQIAMALGYNGISDLHEHNAILSSVKEHIYDATIDIPSIGLIIPETFSKWDFPPLLNKKKTRFKDLSETGIEKIFCLVTSENKQIFKNTIKLLGTRRAWAAQKNGRSANFTLNNSATPESKKYQSKYFRIGYKNSFCALEWFKKHNINGRYLIINNDLICLTKKEGVYEYTDFDYSDDTTIVVSEMIYESWKSNTNHGMTLDEFMKVTTYKCVYTNKDVKIAQGLYHIYMTYKLNSFSLYSYYKIMRDKQIEISWSHRF
jgi:hypothetical protein